MPNRPVKVAADYIAWCSANHESDQTIAATLEHYLAKVLAAANLRALMISARAKSIDSILGKLLRKPYRRPRSQLTDRIGARVIVYHSSDVDEVTNALRRILVVREHDSVDKRSALGLREFGYRSYHLVGSLQERSISGPPPPALRGQVFEVQVRSLLEHIWAEIEHDVIYKSGADWPKEVKRRFASMAGVLELLEYEFQQLTGVAGELVDQATKSLTLGFQSQTSLDVPHMIALLEMAQPMGQGFRATDTAKTPFPPGIEQRLNLALRRAGIGTVGGLRRTLQSNRLKRLIRRYARAETVAPPLVSHLAILGLIIGARYRNLLTTFFPQFALDVSLERSLRR